MTPAGWRKQDRRWQDRLIAWGARRIVRPLLHIPQPWAVHRAGFALTAALRWPVREVKTHKMQLAGRATLVITPPDPQRRICWFHGGGFVLGSPHTHRVMLSYLAHAARATVIAPSYRLAPEHPFPAATDDATATAMAAWHYAPDMGPLVLGGDSAGGGLALTAMAHMLHHGHRPQACLLASPATWMDANRTVPVANDLLFPLSVLRRIGQDYSADHDPNDPRLSPRFAAYPDAPPTLIHCVRREYLEQDSDLIAHCMAEFGAQVTVEKAEGVPHVWHFMAGLSPIANDAIARMGDFVRRHT
ncbi:MAG: alpha/beta hydrolase fold domain-containing protein [Pseudomonadota bacterium]